MQITIKCECGNELDKKLIEGKDNDIEEYFYTYEVNRLKPKCAEYNYLED